MGRGAGGQLARQLFLEALDRSQLVDRRVGHLVDGGEPFRHQQVGDHVVDVERLHEHLGARVELFLTAFRFLGLGQDVDVPAGEVGREPDVLPAPADGKRELLIRHHHLDTLRFLVEHDLGHLGRRERVDDERRRIGRPLNDVDLLALELADDRLHAGAAHADAGADGIDAAVVGMNGDLGAAAGVAGHGVDLDDAVVDLRHFLGEELGHEVRVGAGHEDLRPARFAPDVVDVGAHAVAVAEGFARQQVFAADHRLGPAQVDGEPAILGALDEAVRNLLHAILVFLVLTRPLGLANLLDDHLLRRLRRDAAEVDGRQRIRQIVADLRGRIALLSLADRDLGGLVLDLFGDLQVTHQLDLAGLAVDIGADIVLLTVLSLTGVGDRLLHRLEHELALDPLLPGDGIGHLEELYAGQARGVLIRHHSRSAAWLAASNSSVSTSFAARIMS